MTSQEVQATLKQRYPMLMVDCVASLEEGKSIRAIKNVTVNEVGSSRHAPCHAALPEMLIIEAIGQAASILFAKTTGTGSRPEEFLVLGSINEMTFLKPVIPGDRMEIAVSVSKFVGAFAVVEAVVTVDGSQVAKGKMGFARTDLASVS